MSLHQMDLELDALKEYAEIEGTEIGEACACLIQIARYPDYIGEEFAAALEKEIKEQLQMFKSQTRMVKSERTVTVKCVDLEWLE